jgi:hypothetical protein
MTLSFARPPAGRLRWLAALTAVTAAAAWLAHSLSGTPLVGYDDANIFFVYARNLVDGYGFVYNPGGERVEGFTSLLWVLICSAARAITPQFEVLLVTINVAVVSVALWGLHGFVTDLLVRFAVGDRVRAAALAAALTIGVALTPGFIVWNVVSLMDSGLWSAVFIITTVVVLRPAIDAGRDGTRRALPVLVAVLAVTRPEALLLAPALIAASIVIHGSIGKHVGAAAAFLVTTSALVAWRLSYFGYPLPNTYYAKAGDPLFARIGTGVAYFFDFALSNPLVPLALVGAIVTAVVIYNRHRGAPDADTRSLVLVQAGLLPLLAMSVGIPIIEGGDHFGFWRMFQPLALLAAIQVAVSASVVMTAKPTPSPTPAIAVCVVAILLALVPWRHWAVLNEAEFASAGTPRGAWNTPKVEIAIADDMRAIGAAFNQAFPDEKPSVGVIVAGGFALAYRGPTIDLMGLNNVAMAHSPGPRSGMRGHAAFHPDVFMSLAPDVLLLSLWSPARDWFGFPMLSGDYAQPAHLVPGYFQRRATSMEIFDAGIMKGLLLKSQAGQRYAWASVRPRAGDRWIHAVFNREFLKRLEERNYEVVLPGAAPRVQ